MSAIESVSEVESQAALELSTVLAALKQLGCADLFKVMRTAFVLPFCSRSRARRPKRRGTWAKVVLFGEANDLFSLPALARPSYLQISICQ